MDRLHELIASREVGAVPVSIGTALAIGALCGLNPDVPDVTDPKPPILEVQELWVNVRTLLRNLIGSLPNDARAFLMAEPLYTTLVSEMSIIETAIGKASQGLCRVVFYVCTYQSLERKFPRALHKQHKTELQKFNRALEINALKPFVEHKDSHDVRVFDCEITDKGKSAFILTHFPADLLARYQFVNLTLVESHTGTFKRPGEWHTKLTGGKTLDRIPFCKFSLQMFGDGPTLFNAFPIKIRQAVLAMAEADNWTTVTTDAKIRASIAKVYDPREKTLYLSLL